MKITIVIPTFNQIRWTAGAWGCLVQNTLDKDRCELVVVDNGSTDNTLPWLRKFILPRFKNVQVITNPANVGFPESCQQAYKASSGDIVAVFHNDLFIHEPWDQRVRKLFEHDKKVGLAGFFGARGIGTNGGRIGSISNVLDADNHGSRVVDDQPVAVFDSLALICRRTMLDQVGGFDRGLPICHFLDKDLSLASLEAGWKNMLSAVLCYHIGSTTAASGEYSAWTQPRGGDPSIYAANERTFLERWRQKLPWIVS